MSATPPRRSGPFDPDQINSFLDESVIPLRLGAVAPSGWPVVLSLWFVRDGDALLCATPATSSIVAAVRNEPRCAFEVAGCSPPYSGVRGRAHVTIEPDEGLAVLRRLAERYLDGTETTFARWLLGRDVEEVVLRLEPVTISSWDYSGRMKR